MPVRVSSLVQRWAAMVFSGLSLLGACQFPEYDFRVSVGSESGAGGDGSDTGGATSNGGSPDAPAGQGGLSQVGGEGGAAGVGGASPEPVTCLSLLDADPSLPSGDYDIDPDGSGPTPTFRAHCDMELDGGGWTLLASFLDSTFDANSSGSASKPCYDEPCINRAYSTLPVQADLRIDGASVAIEGDALDSIAIFRDIHPSSLGRSLQEIFTSGTPAFLETANTVPALFWFNDKTCYSWPDFGAALCQQQTILVLEDPSACSDAVFALGVAEDYENLEGNCDGWPQQPGVNYPRALRFWAR